MQTIFILLPIGYALTQKIGARFLEIYGTITVEDRGLGKGRMTVQAQQEQDKAKGRIGVNFWIDKEVFRKFKSRTVLAGKSMREIVEELMKSYSKVGRA